MRTAEEIMDEYGMEMQDFISSSQWLAVKDAINAARKETIRKCSVKVYNGIPVEYAMKAKLSILSLIDELK